jgi:hypothetical protein
MARTAALTTHVEPTVKKAIGELAKKDGRTVGQYIERILLAHLDARTAGRKTGRRASISSRDAHPKASAH